MHNVQGHMTRAVCRPTARRCRTSCLPHITDRQHQNIVKQQTNKKRKIMKTTENIHETSFPQLAKSVNKASLVQGIVVLLLGGASIYSALKVAEPSSSLSMVFLVLGAILAVFALWLMIAGGRHMVYSATGSAVKEDSVYFDADTVAQLERAFASSDYRSIEDVPARHTGNVRIDYQCAADGQFLAMQLFKYVPYTYEAVSDIVVLTGSEAQAAKKYICRQ